MGTSRGRLRDPVTGRLRDSVTGRPCDKIMGRSTDARGKSIKYVS